VRLNAHRPALVGRLARFRSPVSQRHLGRGGRGGIGGRGAGRLVRLDRCRFIDSPGVLRGNDEVRLRPDRRSRSRVSRISQFHRSVPASIRSAREGATIRWHSPTRRRIIRSRIDNTLEGNGSSVEQAEIVFGSSDQLFDLTSYTRHIGRDTTGNLLSKAALTDRSRAYMKALRRSTAGHGPIASSASWHAALKTGSIGCDSEPGDRPTGLSSGRSREFGGSIDETQLFYLESRGIDPDDARKFIVLGYSNPSCESAAAGAQDRLRELLEAKWDARSGAGRPLPP